MKREGKRDQRSRWKKITKQLEEKSIGNGNVAWIYATKKLEQMRKIR